LNTVKLENEVKLDLVKTEATVGGLWSVPHFPSFHVCFLLCMLVS
jgi:hypothetical protein